MVNTSDCGSDIRGFDSPHSPIFLGYSQAVRQGTLTPSCVGSNPATPVILCRRGGIGRRAGLKIQCPQGRAGSTPAAGIVLKTRFSDLVFLFFLPFFLSQLLIITYFFLNLIVNLNDQYYFTIYLLNLNLFLYKFNYNRSIPFTNYSERFIM